jgi:hypothetical protein
MNNRTQSTPNPSGTTKRSRAKRGKDLAVEVTAPKKTKTRQVTVEEVPDDDDPCSDRDMPGVEEDLGKRSDVTNVSAADNGDRTPFGKVDITRVCFMSRSLLSRP